MALVIAALAAEGKYGAKLDKTWYLEDLFIRNVGAAARGVRDPSIAGVLYLAMFNCGFDAVIEDVIARRILAGVRKPYLHVVVDEHSSRVNLRTRLEVQDADDNWVVVPQAQMVLTRPKEFTRLHVMDISDIFISDSHKMRLSYLYLTFIDSIRFDVTADQTLFFDHTVGYWLNFAWTLTDPTGDVVFSGDLGNSSDRPCLRHVLRLL